MPLVLIAMQAALAPDLPPDTPGPVRLFVERVEMCLHWNGEDPHDHDRGGGIDRNLHALRCARTGRDEAALRRRYAGDKGVRRTLDALDRRRAD